MVAVMCERFDLAYVVMHLLLFIDMSEFVAFPASLEADKSLRIESS